MASGHMTIEEREAFLADVRVGILAVDEPGRGPLALPVWYRYVEGVVEISIDGDSLKGRLLRVAGRATLTVQREALPYAYVSVQGPVALHTVAGAVLDLAVRYLGPEQGRRYAEGSDGEGVVVRLTPETWRTFDYGKLG